MPLIQTQDLVQGKIHPQQLQVYNGLDTMITIEVHQALQELLAKDPTTSTTYGFALAMQAPALDMMTRGFKVDLYERDKAVKMLKDEIQRLGGRVGKGLFPSDGMLQRMAQAVWDRPLNPMSNLQLKEFFYGTMHLPEIWTSKRGVRKLSLDRDALEHLAVYHYARPIVNCILAIRDLSKQLSVLETEIDYDGRMRTSYNIVGTETGRWSSSGNAFGLGTNLQNITGRLRKIFIPDEGWKLCGIDLEQAESREVGYQCGCLFGDWSYLDACEGGDLHTAAAKLIWPQRPWTNTTAGDRSVADEIFYRDFTYRDMAKRGGHGSNYLGSPWTMAHHLKVQRRLMEDFQQRYFKAFPGIPKWHQHIATQLQTTKKLVTPFGRTRHFFGRSNDDATLREAVAFVPQSSTGDRLNLAMWRVWKHLPQVQLLAQLHDAFYFQYREEQESGVLPAALSLVSTPLSAPGGRTFDVPGEAKVGWNWQSYDPKKGPMYNPQGLKKWKSSEPETRTRLTEMERLM